MSDPNYPDPEKLDDTVAHSADDNDDDDTQIPGGSDGDVENGGGELP